MSVDAEERLRIISEALEQDKLLKAHKLLQGLKEDLQQPKSTDEEKSRAVGILNSIEGNKKFSVLEDDVKATMELLHDFGSQEGWTLVHDSEDVKTWYRHEQSNPIHSIKLEGVIYAPIFNVCSVIYEIDLYSTWVPRLLESRLLHTTSRFKKNAYCRVSVPWPVASRDSCIYGFGVDMLEESQSVVVMARSCKETDEAHNHPPSPKGVVRVDTKRAGFLLKPISATSTHVQVITNTDPKLTLVPYWLLNLVTKHLAHLSFTTLRQQAFNCTLPDSPYHARIKSNPIYEDLKKLLHSYKG